LGGEAPPRAEPSRVFLTGGTGLLGSHIAERLLAEGHEVVALHRPAADASFLKKSGCTLSKGDIGDDPTQLAHKIEGCRWAVHCAALVYTGKDWSTVEAVNVQGTRNTLYAAAQAGVRHSVHVSSVAVYGQTSGPMDGAGPLVGNIASDNFYGRSKRLAEEAATEIHESGRMQVTIVRPSAVYGERDRLFAPNLARLLRSPVVPVMGRGDNTVPVVYAGNVAAGVASALDGRASGGAFNLAVDYPLTQRELLEGLARGLNRSPTLVSLPAALVRALARVAGGASFMLPGVRGLSAARVVRLALGENPYLSQRARDRLGWRPSVSHESALRSTGRWLLHRHDNEVTAK
jgi:nucleoside-diphosphate-sugar epimerase